MEDPKTLFPLFDDVFNGLEETNLLDRFRGSLNNLLFAFDGVEYHRSTKIHCDQCKVFEPPGMSIEQFKAGVSRIRNPVIARVFKELKLIEEWGSGYKRIKEVCQNEGYPEPLWEELGTVMRVTFFPHPGVTTQTTLEDSFANPALTIRPPN